jgi:hypothetical protein
MDDELEDEFDMYEDVSLHEIYVEYEFDEWPQLASMEEKMQQDLCTAIIAALEAAECPVQVIKVKQEVLHLVAKVNANLSIDDVADIVGYTAECITKEGGEAHGPQSYAAGSLGPADVIEAVMRLR